MKAIAKVKLTYDTAEFASTAEIVAHIQSELKDHYFLALCCIRQTPLRYPRTIATSNLRQ